MPPMRKHNGHSHEVVSGTMSNYLAMCLLSYYAATIVAIANQQYGTPAAVGILLMIGIM